MEMTCDVMMNGFACLDIDGTSIKLLYASAISNNTQYHIIMMCWCRSSHVTHFHEFCDFSFIFFSKHMYHIFQNSRKRQFVIPPRGKNLPNSSRDILPFGDISPLRGGGIGHPKISPWWVFFPRLFSSCCQTSPKGEGVDGEGVGA